MSPDQITVDVDDDLRGRYVVLTGEDTEENDPFAICYFTISLTPESATELLEALQQQQEVCIYPEHAVLENGAGHDFLTGGTLWIQRNGAVDVDVHPKEGEEWSDYDSGEVDYLFAREAVLGYRRDWAAVIFPLTLALGALAHGVPLTTAA